MGRRMALDDRSDGIYTAEVMTHHVAYTLSTVGPKEHARLRGIITLPNVHIV